MAGPDSGVMRHRLWVPSTPLRCAGGALLNFDFALELDAGRRATSGRCADRRARNSARPNYNYGGIRPTVRGASQSHIRLRQLSRRTAPPASRPAA